MQRFVTLLTLSLILAGPAWAQMLDRTSGDDADVVWARDIGSASIVLDGILSEPEWAQAETLDIKWDEKLGFPGSGQFFESNPFGLVDPVDPSDATVAFLRKGNSLYIAVDVRDESIGGSPNLWNFDGIFMTLIDKAGRPTDFSDINSNFSSTRREFAFSWWNRGRAQDSTATGEPIAGLPPFLYSQSFGSDYSDPDSTLNLNRDVIDFGHTIDGVSNDDFNGGSTPTPDVGYTLEFVIPVDSLGWDLTQALSRMPLTIALQDTDYNWPRDENQFSSTRTFWQGEWLNTMTGGNAATAYIAGDPSVTVSSGPTPAYSTPEFTVPNALNVSTPTIDGALDETVWGLVDPQFTLKYQATPEELDAGLPGVLSPYYNFYFHPDANPVLDPTEGRIHMFYQGTTLYMGLDTDDQAVNGIEGEGGRDGFRLLIRSRDSTESDFQAVNLRFDFSIDSTGAARFNNVPAEVEVGTDLTAGVFLKSGSTVADPSDIDAGYQMEVALDLASIGYDPEDGQKLWVSLTFFDGDALQDESQSYATRTWSMGERTTGASIMGYLDPATLIVTADEGDLEVGELRFTGSFPNPTTGAATLRYELDRASAVTVEVFDVLGRRVQHVEAGLQSAGARQVEVDGTALSAGSYLVRVRLDDGTSVTGRMLIAR